jgi:hypothetical protein
VAAPKKHKLVAPDDGATLAPREYALQEESAAFFTLAVFSKSAGVFM